MRKAIDVNLSILKNKKKPTINVGFYLN